MSNIFTFYASGSKGKEVRGDGKGGALPRGWYFRKLNQELKSELVGPFTTERKAIKAMQ